jgi:hypothetical protein
LPTLPWTIVNDALLVCRARRVRSDAASPCLRI